MKLRLLFTESVPQSCPTVYETDRGTFVIQGDRLTDPEARADLANILPGEDAVETPRETLLGAMRVTSGASRMLAADSEEFLQLFETFEHTAFRFETLDQYAVPEEDQALRRFLAGEPPDPSLFASWFALVQAATAAGKTVQRVHLFSEPLTDYMRYEFAYYPHSAAAGEDVRVLPRAQAQGLDLPGRDYWLFDSRQAALMRFDADGHFYGVELTDDPHSEARCCYWRDLALHHAIPYDRYAAAHPEQLGPASSSPSGSDGPSRRSPGSNAANAPRPRRTCSPSRGWWEHQPTSPTSCLHVHALSTPSTRPGAGSSAAAPRPASETSSSWRPALDSCARSSHLLFPVCCRPATTRGRCSPTWSRSMAFPATSTRPSGRTSGASSSSTMPASGSSSSSPSRRFAISTARRR